MRYLMIISLISSFLFSFKFLYIYIYKNMFVSLLNYLRGKSFSDRPIRVHLLWNAAHHLSLLVLGFISFVGLEFNFGLILWTIDRTFYSLILLNMLIISWYIVNKKNTHYDMNVILSSKQSLPYVSHPVIIYKVATNLWVQQICNYLRQNFKYINS